MPPKPWSGRWRPPSRYRRDGEHKPTSAKAIAVALPDEVWQTVTWREGTNTTLTSRLAAVRFRPAHRDYWLSEPYPEEWLLIEQPDGESEPTKYWLSSLPDTTLIHDLVASAKLCWRIERNYPDLKQEFGFGHYEGRGWRGSTITPPSASRPYAFLVSERSLIPSFGPRIATLLPIPALPDDYRPHGGPAEDPAARG